MVKQAQIAFARKLRREMSYPERLIWGRIKGRDDGVVFKRQYPFDRYVFDFYCAKIKLVVEIDGWGHNMGDTPRKDEIRDQFLQERGFDVMRIPASDVIADPDDIADGIYRYALERLKVRC
jgi:very-short-patch-repair endonuclease